MSKFLVVNTASAAVEVALSNGNFIRDEDGRRASSALMPGVDDLLSGAGLTLHDLDYIACVSGPGSFTGIRIGVSSVRAICYALGKPALPINYLQSLAYNDIADGSNRILCVTDASNGMAYIGEFDRNRREISPTKAVTEEEAISYADSYDGIVCADEKFSPKIKRAVPPPKDCSHLVRAANELGGVAGDYNLLVPLYVRESQAEQDLKKVNK